MSEKTIGLDFGTTNSTITYMEDGRLEAFRYGGPDGRKYIPSFVAYEDEDLEVGLAARASAAFRTDIESYGNFKMHLPLSESGFSIYFKEERTPSSVTIDYLREILVSSENEYSFTQQQGEIEKLVVSVPEIWHRDARNTGRERLQKLIREELGFGDKLIQLVSEPVAAAAYYAWENQHRSSQEKDKLFSGNLLVCDMGGGTFDVSLCKVCKDGSVEVLYFDGEGHSGLECAGVAFDKYCVQSAHIKKHGKPLDEKDPKLKNLVRSFEAVKIDSHSRCTKLIKRYLSNPEKFADKTVYNFGEDYSLTNKEVSEVFEPISVGISRVMHRIEDWLKTNNQTFDRLFLVGGFCQFSLVQQAIFDALGIKEEDPRYDKSINIASSSYAVSFGACVIANGLISPSEQFVHEFGIEILDPNRFKSNAGFLHSIPDKHIDLSLINGDKSLSELIEPSFGAQKLTALSSEFPLTIWVSPQSTDSKYSSTINITLPNHNRESIYQVGMRVDRSLVAHLVIKEIKSGAISEYALGDIISKSFANDSIETDSDRWLKFKHHE